LHQNTIEFGHAMRYLRSLTETWLHLSEECYDFALKISLKAASMPLLALASMSDSETSSDLPSA